MILLDTNVISELLRMEPNERVTGWIDRQPRQSIWTTSVSIFEVRFGLETMPPGKKQAALGAAFERWLEEVVAGRIANFDQAAARCAAEYAGQCRSVGRPGELRDTMIAGIVMANEAKLATRNGKHFEMIARAVVNPWEG